MKHWLASLNWWELHFFLPVGMYVALSVVGAIGISILMRADDIYNNRSTQWKEMWATLLWPIAVLISIPGFVIEQPAQLVAKYREFKRNKKLHLNKNKVA